MEAFWLFAIILVCLVFYIKWALPAWIGRSGERYVSKELRALDRIHYKILDNIMLPSNGNIATTQIDHVVVSNYGVFCIETKAYKGWIFGDAHQDQWTQVIYRYKKRFLNPLRQNYAHMKAIEKLLGSRLKKPIISLIAFSRAEKLKISGTDSVGYAQNIVRKIASYTEQVFSDAERDDIYCLLTTANIIDKKARNLHNKKVGCVKKRKL